VFEEFIVNLPQTLNSLSFETLDLDDLVDVIARNFEWMDTPIWGGHPEERGWHAFRIQAAYRILCSEHVSIIDSVHDQFQKIIELSNYIIELRMREYHCDGDPTKPESIDILELNLGADDFEKLQIVHSGRDRLVEYAYKIGFLYRDRWWFETHGGAALDGYLARVKSAKAGKGGAKASSSARMKRITCFLSAHANLVRDNPALRTDAPEELALRALKLAAKAHPELFKNARSRKTALEYWDYIRSDSNLWQSYRKKVKEFKA
jgi:hypothetical protein